MRVYLDNCALNRPSDDQNQSRIHRESEAIQRIREIIICGDIELVWSYVIDVENNRNPFPSRRSEVDDWRILSGVEVAPSLEIVSNAIDLRNIGFKEVDSLHISCAMAAKSNYFITTDDGILKKSTLVADVRSIGPTDFLKLVDRL